MIKSVGIVGGGTMGMGIAQTLAQQGLPITICDLDLNILNQNLERTSKNLAKLVERQKMNSDQAQNTLQLISLSDSMKDIANNDLIIEAIFEDINIKKDLFTKLDSLCPPNTILATNTSVLSPTEIGSVTKRTDKTIGMHWFNPAPVMKLIEVTSGIETSEETIQSVMDFCKKIGKPPVKVNEAPGGIVSRVLRAMLNSAVDILSEGTASVEDIDTAMKLGANFPMGPLELIDLIGG